MNYNKINNLFGWLIAALSTMVYISTADRFNSWWDTGEFIASAYKLQIVHQPGAPLFLMLQNVFSNLADGDVTRIAYWMNVGSAVCSGLTVLFLFWTITALARKIVIKSNAPQAWDVVLVMLAGLVGAGAYAFTDSFWYSAVESEVYAMSSLCTAVVFWLVLKWDKRADEADANRWLLLIMYIMGLSIGVHLLNLLTIPAIALIVYFRKKKTVSAKGVAQALTIGVAILAFILWGVIQYLVRFAAQFDLFFVNQLGLNFGSGVLFFCMLLLAGLCLGIWHSIKAQKALLNTWLLGLCFVLFGYSSYVMIIIRAHADPSLNNNAPDNVFSFLGYLSREQYASEPLFKGPMFDAKVTDATYAQTYKKGADKYEKMTGSPSYSYDKEMLLPRVYSEKHQDYYRMYLGLKEGESPSFIDNLRFLFSYQLGDMYGRYFMWNFAGRQNDEQWFAANNDKGNWLSGIAPLDNTRLAAQQDVPKDRLVNPSRNIYYYVPLLIGMAGLLWHFRRDSKNASIVALLFFFTGIAIVLYLNQTPMQPRERDYAYAGSFYAFSIWIGFGVLAIADLLRRKLALRTASIAAGALCALGGPVLLLSENYDDHDRSERDFARSVAYNYLNSCEPNAILFTYADNDTFPIWYLQEVEGVRKDVRIVNVSYLASHWYFRQLKNRVNEAAPVDTSIAPEKLAQGVRDYLPYIDQGIADAVDIDMLMEFLLSDNNRNQVKMHDGSFVNYLPARKIKMSVDKQAVMANKVVPAAWADAVVDEMEWEYKENHMTRAEIAILGVVKANNWKRPIYCTNYTPDERMAGLSKYMVDEGLVKKLMPVSLGSEQQEGALVNVEKLYENASHVFRWGNYGKQQFIDVDSRNYMANFVVPQIYERATKELKASGQWAKAKEVALMAASILPQRVYDAQETYHYTEIVDTLYKVKEATLAGTIVKRHMQFLDDKLIYTQTLARDKQELIDLREIQLSVAALAKYHEILKTTADKTLYAQVDDLYARYRKSFYLDE